MYFVVIKQLSVMALIALIGFTVSKIFKFGKTEQNFLSKLLLYVINPCLILKTFDVSFTQERLKELFAIIAISFLAHFLLMLIALIFCNSKTPEGKSLDGIDKLSVVFTNCAFIGIPLINGVFGSGGAFYLMGYIAVFNITLWTFGYYMVCGKMQPLKVITNPNVLAVILGIILFCLPINLPDIISIPLGFIGDMNTATSMLLLGLLFANFKRGETPFNTYILRVIKVSVLRLVVSAVVMFFVALLSIKIFSGLENIRLMSYVVYIAALCPVGMSVSSFAVVFNKDESYASLNVACTSALCILTLPLSVAIAEKFF